MLGRVEDDGELSMVSLSLNRIMWLVDAKASIGTREGTDISSLVFERGGSAANLWMRFGPVHGVRRGGCQK
jgi:hypothetical protein